MTIPPFPLPLRALRKSGLIFSIITAAVGIAVAQTATPTPRDDQAVVKISTNLIQLDVTVTDSKGKVVTDLRADEIEIYENGEKQKVAGLSFISSVRSAAEKPRPTDPGVPPVPPAIVRPDQIRRTMAFVVDDLSLSFESAYYTRRALKKFVDEQMQDGELVAIIRTGAGIGALQQFTSDKRILYAAIEKVKWNPLGRGGIGAFAPLEPRLPPDENRAEPTPGERTPEGIEREFNEFRNSVFATGTLGAVNYIVRGMSELPGRKSVVLLSDGFKLAPKDALGFRDAGPVLEAITRLVDQANRASVVIYSLDPRGLQTLGLTAADSVGSRTGEEVQQAMSDRREELLETQDGLVYLAKETGGFAIINNNDLSGGVRRVLDDQSYYLVSYEPDSDTFDPAKRRFNKLDVKVLRPGVKVRYRSGFFNVADREKPGVPTRMTAINELEYALVSPFAVSGIDLRMNALFGYDARNSTYVRPLLHVNAKDLKFTDVENGSKRAVFDVLAVSFGDNGQAIDQIAKNYTMTVTPDAYNRILRDGFVYHFAFPVKKPGAYQYRVAIRDSQSGQVGSASQFVEVPDLKKKRLTVSSIVLETISADLWQQATSENAPDVATDPMSDTALRRVGPNSVLRYGFEIYNAKLDPSKQPRLETRIRVFRDGKLILDGKPTPFELKGQTDMPRLRSTGAIAIGDKMTPGDHILQVIVTDKLAGPKQQIASQFVQFEVVK